MKTIHLKFLYGKEIAKTHTRRHADSQGVEDTRKQRAYVRNLLVELLGYIQ